MLDEDYRLIGIEELAKLLDRKKGTVRVDITRRPNTLPPKVSLPGSRRVVFKLGDVKKWIDQYTEGK